MNSKLRTLAVGCLLWAVASIGTAAPVLDLDNSSGLSENFCTTCEWQQQVTPTISGLLTGVTLFGAGNTSMDLRIGLGLPWYTGPWAGVVPGAELANVGNWGPTAPIIDLSTLNIHVIAGVSFVIDVSNGVGDVPNQLFGTYGQATGPLWLGYPTVPDSMPAQYLAPFALGYRIYIDPLATSVATPEPATIILFAISLLGFLLLRIMRTVSLRTVAIHALLGLAVMPSQVFAFAYSIADLGSFNPLSVNNIGQVVGYARVSGQDRAVIYSDGSLSLLSQLPGALNSRAQGINDAGQIVGISTVPDDQYGSVGAGFFMGSAASAPVLLGCRSLYVNCNARAINNSGVTVGHTDGGALTWTTSSSPPFLVGSLGSGYSIGTNINDVGQVVGYSNVGTPGAYGAVHAFLNGGGTMTDLGALPGSNPSYPTELGIGDYTRARDVNNLGQVVGDGTINGNNYAFLYSDGVMMDLGIGPGAATAIDDSSVIVGFRAESPGVTSGFMYSDGVVNSLASLLPSGSGWTNMIYAIDINNVGQIIGFGDHDGVGHAFLMTPVPAPRSNLLFLTALSILWLFRRGNRPRWG